MTDCEYCHRKIDTDDEFILAGKFPSAWQKWKDVRLNFHWDGQVSPEDFGNVYHKSCFLEMMKNEGSPSQYADGNLPQRRISLTCPHCKMSFWTAVHDDYHAEARVEKPREVDIVGDVIEEVKDCPNPNCRKPIILYWYHPKDMS